MSNVKRDFLERRQAQLAKEDAATRKAELALIKRAKDHQVMVVLPPRKPLA